MSTPIPAHALIRSPLRYIAFWQGMTFVLLACALWACETFGLLHEGMPDFKRLFLPTILLAFGGVIAVGHTYIQEHRIVHGLIAICSYCHKVRVADHAWTKIEQFVSQHSRADFTHGVCPECFTRITDELAKETPGDRTPTP